MIKATDFIDNTFDWYGKKASSSQSLRFPRVGLYDNDGYLITEVPKALKDAVCIASGKIVNGTTLFQEKNQNGAVTSEHIGELSFTYDVAQITKDATLYDEINLRLRGLYRDKTKQTIYAINVKRTI